MSVQPDMRARGPRDRPVDHPHHRFFYPAHLQDQWIVGRPDMLPKGKRRRLAGFHEILAGGEDRPLAGQEHNSHPVIPGRPFEGCPGRINHLPVKCVRLRPIKLDC